MTCTFLYAGTRCNVNPPYMWSLEPGASALTGIMQKVRCLTPKCSIATAFEKHLLGRQNKQCSAHSYIHLMVDNLLASIPILGEQFTRRRTINHEGLVKLCRRVQGERAKLQRKGASPLLDVWRKKICSTFIHLGQTKCLSSGTTYSNWLDLCCPSILISFPVFYCYCRSISSSLLEIHAWIYHKNPLIWCHLSLPSSYKLGKFTLDRLESDKRKL